MPTDDSWTRLLEAPRSHAGDLTRPAIPQVPGVYAWFRDDECVYVGLAGTSLRSRLSAHLATTTDLSRSTLRATVAVNQLGVTRTTARSRPPILTTDQVGVVNEWLRACDVAWLTCPTRLAAVSLEKTLRETRLPRLNLV